MSTCALLPVDFTAQSLCRVTSATLDPSKHWYLLLKEVCGVPLRKFFIRDVFKIFPNEIQSVAARELQPAKLSFGVVEMDRIPDVVHIVSTLCPRSVWLLVFFAIKKFPTNLLILRDLWQS